MKMVEKGGELTTKKKRLHHVILSNENAHYSREHIKFYKTFLLVV